jgi:hypothetical protein
MWLPGIAFDSAFRNLATRIAERDAFVYEGTPQRRDAPPFDFQGPYDGTFFLYGDAGPPKGRVVYDYAHHIAFYEQGCCSWQEIAAGYASPPPKTVANRDLTNLVTVRGIRLGMSTEAVERVYGRAKLVPVPKRIRTYVLPYTTWPPKQQVTVVRMPCGQFQNFYFRDNRLILIQIGNGC